MAIKVVQIFVRKSSDVTVENRKETVELTQNSGRANKRALALRLAVSADIMHKYDTVHTVMILERGFLECAKRPVSEPGIACYCMSYKCGKWSKSSYTDVHESDRNARKLKLQQENV